MDHVAGQQLGIVLFVAPDQKAVKVQGADHRAFATQFDAAQRALKGRPAAREQSVHQRAERTDGIDPAATGFAGDIDLDGADIAELHRKVKVAVNLAYRGAEQLIEVREADSSG